MRWFKHFTDNHRGRSIQDLLDQLGHTGLCYYLLMELCAEKLERKPDKCVEDSDCLFRFHLRVVRQMLRISSANLRRLLDICSANGLLSYRFHGMEVEINMPMLLELLDYDSKKSRRKTDKIVKKSRLEEEEETDTYTDTDKDTYSSFPVKLEKKKPEKPDDPGIIERREIKQSYIDAYFLRYGIEPASNNQTFNSQIKTLHKKFGKDESIKIIKFYLTHNDGQYLKASHSIGMCVLTSDSLRTQMLRNKPITSALVRQYENASNPVKQKSFSQQAADKAEEMLRQFEGETNDANKISNRK